MPQPERPLYGELVDAFMRAQEASTGEREMHEMEAHVRRMTEETACLLAQARGFAPGYEMQDWQAAEQRVKRQLGLES